jgi:hypothetical protein
MEAEGADARARNARDVIRQVAEALERAGREIEYWPPSFMREVFCAKLADFLRVRMEAVRGQIFRPKWLNRKELGLSVTVSSPTQGLKIVYSPAFFLTCNTFGNRLSSPVHGHLQPGIYYFGAIDPEIDGVRWENSLETIPPVLNINLVNF